MQEVIKRMKRIVGDFDESSLYTFDNKHFFVKPNSFSKSGILIDGKVIQPIGYGEIGVIPVSMTYGLTQEQISKVMQNCVFDLKRIVRLLESKAYIVASEIAKEIIEELCLCLNSVKKPEDKTLKDVVKRLDLKNRTLYSKIVKVLSKIPKVEPQKLLALCITPLYRYSGKYGRDFLLANQKELIEHARSSCVPFLTDSTFEQDHFGLQKMSDDDLMSDKDEYDAKREVVDFSPMFINGVDTLSERVGCNIESIEKRQIDPVKKKRLFTKANKIMSYLENNDDEIMLETFGRIASILDLGNDEIEYERMVTMPHHSSVETPFVIPVIVQDTSGDYIQVEYQPMDALELLSEKMNPDDFLGSMNNENKPFPFGADIPLAKPRRVKSEVR